MVSKGSRSDASVERSTTGGGQALTKAETLLCHEFDQAWDHYRHNETTRSQYLGYFFALSLGSVAFGAQAVKSRTLASGLDLALLAAFLLVFALLTGFVYLRVRKAGVVLTHYDLQWNKIREYFYSRIDIAESPYSSLSIRRSDHRALRSRWTRLQSSSEFVILFFSGVTVLSQILLTARIFLIHNANWLERATAIVVAGLTVAIPIVLVRGLGTSFGRFQEYSTNDAKETARSNA